jgi:hypothetical protein
MFEDSDPAINVVSFVDEQEAMLQLKRSPKLKTKLMQKKKEEKKEMERERASCGHGPGFQQKNVMGGV